MAEPGQTYTYRAGKKIALNKKPDEFVVRVLPAELAPLGLSDAEQVSSTSSRVKVRSSDLEPMMAQSRHLAPTHHAYTVAETGEEFLITDRVFVIFREPQTAEQVAEFAGRYGLVLLETYSDREYLFQLTNHTGMNPVKLVVRLTEDEPAVELAEHDLNYRATKQQLALPTDPLYQRQWHLHTRFSHPDVDPRSSARCEDAWQFLGGYGSAEVVVGVTDDGCKLDHPDFDSPGKFAGWGYFQGTQPIRDTSINADPARMYQPGADHGTSCAGVIAGEVDAVLSVGAAPGCRLLPVKWESSGPSLFISDSKLRTVLDYIADKVDILSNSWGITPTSLWSPIVTRRIAELVQTGGRRGRGIIFLWAAGNDNCPIQHTTTQDVPYTTGWEFRSGSWVWVGVQTSRTFENNLVGIPGVMHIAALASTAQRSHYSNYGTGLTLTAPTSNGHTYSRLPVRGLGITTATGAGSGATQTFGGTSSATPLVAGIAALTISANPDLTALEVISVLKRTASKDLRVNEGYPRTPPASFDPNTSWDISPVAPFDSGDFRDIGDPDGAWSPWFGHGRVDALAAVAAARGMREGAATVTLRLSSEPSRAIPDNDATGIQDVIHVGETGLVQDLKVSVDIEHTWIGDLVISLTAPDGSTVVLHNRAGASQDNLHQTYDPTTAPALAALRDRQASGDWTLRVQDLAALDVGVLKTWTLELTLTAAPLVARDAAAVRVPDNDRTGITRSLSLPGGRTINELAVAVDITHPWIGDLVVELTPPGGAPVLLHNRAGGSADNIVKTWRTADNAGLLALRGKQAGGEWRLRVADLAARDVGKLNHWQIEVT